VICAEVAHFINAPVDPDARREQWIERWAAHRGAVEEKQQ